MFNMNINFKFLLLGTSLSLITNLTQAQCVATTDCATLGYTETSCSNGKGLKCPFGNTFACFSGGCSESGFIHDCTGVNEKPLGNACNKKYYSCACASGYEWKNGKCEEKQVPGTANLGQCTGYAKNCKIGDILNSDGTCSENKENNKTPIGVVVYIGKDNCGQALALAYLGSMSWSTKHVDIATLPNYTDIETSYSDFDSCGNTHKIIREVIQEIIQEDTTSTYPAAWQSTKYAPASLSVTRGKWCLPAAGIAKIMIDNYDKINTGLRRAGGENLNKNYINWSSSENSNERALKWSYADGYLDTFNGYKGFAYYVRPVIEF